MVKFINRSKEPEYEQLQLDLGTIKSPNPWSLSRRQFEKLGDTVWRAESSETLGSHYDPMQSGGIHFGTEQSAIDRGGEVAAVRAAGYDLRPPVGEDQPVRLFSARVKGRFSNKRSDPGRDVGAYWPERKTGYWYKNRAEDKGSVSGYVPRREGFLQTHRELVLDAINRGEDVHPHIRWEAENAPEWSDTVQPREGWRPHDPGPLFPGHISGGNKPYLLNMYQDEALKKGGLWGLQAYMDANPD